MKTKKQLLEDVLKIARETIPSIELFDISIDKGKLLAKEYNADEELVLIGICFMDIKLGEAVKQGKGLDHVNMGLGFAKDYLKEYDLTDEEKDKIMNCIEAHHGDIAFSCIESEICANADCYRFIHPFGVFAHANLISKKVDDFKTYIEQLKFKLEEKYNILSLKKAKEELEYYYEIYSKQFNDILESLND